MERQTAGPPRRVGIRRLYAIAQTTNPRHAYDVAIDGMHKFILARLLE